MRRRSSDLILVGSFVLFTMGILLGSLLWLAGAQLFRPVDTYEVVFDRSVSGLTPGASVEFQGVIVGRVQRLKLTEEIPPRVSVVVTVEPGTPVRRDTHAYLFGSLVTGIKWIALQGGTPEAGPLEEGGIIPGDVTAFDELGDQVAEIGSRILVVAERLDSQIFTAENNAKLSEFVTDIASLARSLRSTIEPFREQETGKEITKLVKHVGRAADNIDRLTTDLSAEEGGIHGALQSLEDAALETSALVRTMRSELTGTGSALTTLLADLTNATNRLEETLDLIQDDPSLLIRGRAAEDD